MNEEKILEFAKSEGYNYIEYAGEWKGYKVYDLIISKEYTSFVGYPLVALVNDEEIRISTPEESLEVLDVLYPNEEGEDEE